MNFLDFAKQRYSVRKFKANHIEQEIIEQIIEAGHIAPTGCNNQPQRILVINSDTSVEKLKKCTKCHFDAPTAMLICYNKDESWIRKYDNALSAPVDASIVTTHMMLMAHSLGIGSTWVMHFDPEAVKTEFNIPENIIPHALLVMGYPHEDSKPFDMHNAYRDINDVIFYDSF